MSRLALLLSSPQLFSVGFPPLVLSRPSQIHTWYLWRMANGLGGSLTWSQMAYGNLPNMSQGHTPLVEIVEIYSACQIGHSGRGGAANVARP